MEDFDKEVDVFGLRQGCEADWCAVFRTSADEKSGINEHLSGSLGIAGFLS